MQTINFQTDCGYLEDVPVEIALDTWREEYPQPGDRSTVYATSCEVSILAVHLGNLKLTRKQLCEWIGAREVWEIEEWLAEKAREAA